jgi:hypothetical protein
LSVTTSSAPQTSPLVVHFCEWCLALIVTSVLAGGLADTGRSTERETGQPRSPSRCGRRPCWRIGRNWVALGFVRVEIAFESRRQRRSGMAGRPFWMSVNILRLRFGNGRVCNSPSKACQRNSDTDSCAKSLTRGPVEQFVDIRRSLRSLFHPSLSVEID